MGEEISATNACLYELNFLCFDLDLNAEDVAVHCLNLNPTLHHLLLSKSTIQYTIWQDVSEIPNDQDKE